MQKYFLLNISLVLVQLTGCTSRSPDGKRNAEQANTSIRQTHAASVTMIDQQGLKSMIHARNGKYLLLNIWATWCQPCVEEFPDLIRLAQTDSLVEVVGVSVDYPDEIQSKVRPFLEKLKVPFRVYVAQVDKQDDFISAIDTSWSGAIPATYIYDAGGRKQYSHIGRGTMELFEGKMKEMRQGQQNNTLAKVRGVQPS